VLARVGLVVEPRRPAPQVTAGREVSGEGVKAVLLAIETEPGVTLPAALYLPSNPAPGPVILHAGEWGKPATLAEESLPRALARRGLPVLSIDLRGLGETDVREGKRNPSAGGWDEHQWVRDQYAIMASGYLQRTIPAMQAYDLIRAGDALAADPRTTERPVRLVGEGYAGLPALLAAVAAPFESVTTIGTLASLEWLVRQPLHEVRNYFWMPGALADFDLPVLAVAAAPQPVTWLNPTDHLAQPTDPSRCDDLTAWARAMAGLLGQTVAWRQVDPGSDSLAAAVAR
ncbi:MAG: hypothetical protein HUU35_13450, partial [Armatimonadetes bacterium]|nr:hypothetical protein [Armatimonadota bacterium]